MAIAYAAIGSTATGTTSLSVPLPAGISAGDILLLIITNYAGLQVTPSGYFLIGFSDLSGAGAIGVDSGTRRSICYMRIADGTESGNVSVTGLTNTAIGVILRYTKSSVKDIQVILEKGNDTTAGTAWNITGLRANMKSGDMLIAASAINTDNYTYSAQAITVTGPTLGSEVERFDAGTSNGNDSGLVISEHPITTADHSVSFSYAMTASGTAGNAPAGATLIIILREVDPPEELEGLNAVTEETKTGEADKPVAGFIGITMEYGQGLNISVRDYRGRGLAGVKVDVENPDTTSPTSQFTDSFGNVIVDEDGSNPNPITFTKNGISKTVNYVSGNSLAVELDFYPLLYE